MRKMRAREPVLCFHQIPLFWAGSPTKAAASRMPSLVAIVDDNALGRECLTQAFEAALPDWKSKPYSSADDVVEATRTDIGLILYYDRTRQGPAYPSASAV